jgi:hypothetical protein
MTERDRRLLICDMVEHTLPTCREKARSRLKTAIAAVRAGKDEQAWEAARAAYVGVQEPVADDLPAKALLSSVGQPWFNASSRSGVALECIANRNIYRPDLPDWPWLREPALALVDAILAGDESAWGVLGDCLEDMGVVLKSRSGAFP